MRTNVEINESKVSKVMEAGLFGSKKQAINKSLNLNYKAALKKEIANMFGKIHWEGNLEDWRSSRNSKWDGSGL